MTPSIRLLIATFAFSMFASGALAENQKMNVEIHDVVIEKLEKALSAAREDETLSLRPVRYRLADLYSERARLRAMDEAERSCSECKGALEDRNRALKLYEVVEREAEQSAKGRILLQMAHLNEVNNDRDRAEKIYDRIVREGVKAHGREVVSQGYAGRAERRFARGQFAPAKADFEGALKLATRYRRGPLMHRIAWCELNLGNQERAVSSLTRLLKTPDLLMRESTDGPILDVSFQDDATLDLVTFLARGPVGPREIQLVETLSSDRALRDNMKHLASETERLGNKRAALAAWDAFLAIDGSEQDRLEVMVRVARIRFDLGEKPAALKNLQQASTQWKKHGCKEVTVCDNLRLTMRKLVADWNKLEKKKLTPEVLAAYQAYLAVFDTDLEMTFWAALVAQNLNRPIDAVALYHKSSLLAAEHLKSTAAAEALNAKPAADAKDAKQPEVPKNLKEMFEASLVGEIEMAELTKNFDLREAAYDHYLKMAPAGPIAHQVRYQRARLAYERGNMKEAVRRLETFALSEDCRAEKPGKSSKDDKKQDKSAKGGSLCVQAADLDLDARVALKDDDSIESGALTYAKIYTQRRMEYLKIARTAGLKLAEKMSPEKAVAKLAAIDMTGADDEERLRILKIRISAGEKARDLASVRSASQQMLAMKKLSEKDREFAMARLAWAAEMAFDFDQAYSLSLKLEMPQLKPADRELRLAVLAELAGRNPRRHEEAFLAQSKDAPRRAMLRAKMVRDSENPLRELRRHEAELERFPAVYAPLALEIFARTGDREFAARVMKSRRLANEPAGRAIGRQLFLSEFSKVEKKLERHQIRTSSEFLMQSTLTERLQLIGTAESGANHAIATGDWASQLITLSVVSRENKRLAAEVVELPVPKKLKGKAREDYVKAVEAQAKSMVAKHKEIEKKLDAFWADSKAFDALVEDYQNARPELRTLMSREMKLLAELASGSPRRKLEKALDRGSEGPKTSEIASVVRDIRERPFNERSLERLRKLESVRGRETMVAYLDARLTKLKQGEVR